MSRNSRRHGRGFTLAELMTVLSILALLGGLMTGIIAPIISAPTAHQAKTDTLQTTVKGLYKIQRDLRQTDAAGVFVCSVSGAPVCAQPAVLTPGDAVVVVSARSNGQSYWSAVSGQPQWKGYDVYWLAANASGGKDLKETFIADSSLGSGAAGLPDSSKAQAAVATAMASANAVTALSNLRSISLAVNSQANTIGFAYVAQSTVRGRTNQTSFQSNVFARN